MSTTTLSGAVGEMATVTVAVLEMLGSDFRETLTWNANVVREVREGAVKEAVGDEGFWIVMEGVEGLVWVHAKSRTLLERPDAVLEPRRRT